MGAPPSEAVPPEVPSSPRPPTPGSDATAFAWAEGGGSSSPLSVGAALHATSDDAVVVPADADPLATDLAALVNRLIAGPMDYAVIGRKVES